MTLRVLIVVPVAVYGGAGEVLVNEICAAGAGGYEPHVALLQPGPLVDDLRQLGVPLVVLDSGRLREPGAVRRTWKDLGQLVERLRPDVVLSTEAKAHLYAALPARRARVAAVWQQPALPTWQSPIDVLASALPAARVIVAAEHVARRQRSFPFGPPVAVITPGIDLERFTPPHAPGPPPPRSGDPTVAIVGRLQRWKGQDMLLRAAPLILEHRPRARFLIVGGADMGWERGDYPGELRAIAADLGIAEQVTFTGHVRDVPGLLAEVDVVVSASDREPFGLVIVEAMAMELPVVAIASGGPVGIIAHGETGLLVGERQPAPLGRAILALLDDPAWARDIGVRARLAVCQRYGRERMARELGDVLRAVIAG